MQRNLVWFPKNRDHGESDDSQLQTANVRYAILDHQAQGHLSDGCSHLRGPWVMGKELSRLSRPQISEPQYPVQIK